ncbi:hypothetical protein GOODEAATRI_007675 [Goodea atripinnis]|uniref:Prolactin receptor n=1 Tax=Goodea atripinnis TaxID=208336 RepID=A0ABV0PC83_9TELE
MPPQGNAQKHLGAEARVLPLPTGDREQANRPDSTAEEKDRSGREPPRLHPADVTMTQLRLPALLPPWSGGRQGYYNGVSSQSL